MEKWRNGEMEKQIDSMLADRALPRRKRLSSLAPPGRRSRAREPDRAPADSPPPTALEAPEGRVQLPQGRLRAGLKPGSSRTKKLAIDEWRGET